MARRGPPPKSKSELEATGSWRAKDRGEIELPAGDPVPPGKLTTNAKWMWEFIAGECRTRGILTPMMAPSLYLLATAWDAWIESEKQLKSSGAVAETAAGDPKMHPAFQANIQCWNRVLAGLKEFGMTLVSTPRLNELKQKPVGGTDNDPRSKFFGKLKAG